MRGGPVLKKTLPIAPKQSLRTHKPSGPNTQRTPSCDLTFFAPDLFDSEEAKESSLGGNDAPDKVAASGGQEQCRWFRDARVGSRDS